MLLDQQLMAKEFTGRHMTAILVGFFGVVIAVNLTMASYATGTFGGVVVDFMNVGIGPLRSGVFNIADLAIIAGIVVLFIHGWKEDRRKKLAASTSPAAN